MASLADAEEALCSTSTRANFQRLTRLLMCGGLRLLRETFDSIHSPADLPLRLSDPTIQTQLKGARLTRPEWNCLYPSRGVYGKSTDFDITLIFRLLRTICNLTPPPGPRGWDDLPNNSDHSLGADLVRIKYYRNEVYGHSKAMEITDTEFNDLWGKISEALIRIAAAISREKKDEWKKSIDRFLLDALTPEEERCIEELNIWYKQDMDVKSEVEKLKEDLNTLMSDVKKDQKKMHEEVTKQSQLLATLVMKITAESITHCGSPNISNQPPSRPQIPQEASESRGICAIHIPDQEGAEDDVSDSGGLQLNSLNSPTERQIWTVIISFKKSFELFFQYLAYKLDIFAPKHDLGSLLITVECSSLPILEGLWEDYSSGHLNAIAQEMLVTAEVLEKLGVTDVRLKTFISEEEYEKRKQIFMDHSASSDDEGFDLIQPSLIQQLRKILDEYPDHGQILKELIQNAEDAGATHVKFLHDKNSYGKAQLYDKKLEKFQGPALYAYNNALFTTADWKGIRLVCDSIKVEDPMKVGRFGLGFKSVFHMTDLPSLLSEYQIGFIDPHGVHFSDEYCRRTGKRWRLREDSADIERIPDQFNPFKGIFDCNDEVFSRGRYNGTLFRFPLRSSPSKLSDTLYTAEKVETLFESFKADAHLMLVFLQHLESIELYVKEENERNHRRVFQVKIVNESLQTVRAKREEFRSKITLGKVVSDSITVTYPITIETVDFDLSSADNTKKHSFLVTNYFCGGQVSATFKKLMTDKVLSYLPMVGVAMALPTGPRLQTPDIKGHVFCFLPLPVQKASLTGLPVHVNGFFALNQNRCYIKSPNADQEEGGRQLTDRSLLWNKCLLEEAIPRAYATMILEAIKEKSVFVPKVAIYKAWPDIHSVNQKWKSVVKPFFRFLLDKHVVHTEANGGSWGKVKEAIFQKPSGEHWNDLLLRVLISVGLPAVAVPNHVHSALDKYASSKIEIEPRLIRHVLREVPSSYVNLKRKEKLLLLQFSLSDRHFSDLEGLQLLPLSNGQFAKFEARATTVYIASSEHPQELFAALDDRFLDKSVHEDIVRVLKEAVSQGKTQLRLLSRDHVPSLLRKSLPFGWDIVNSVSWFPGDKNHNHPPRHWIQIVWRYLGNHFTTSKALQSFEGLPLIPLNMSQTPVTLTQLCHPSKVVVKRLNWECIDDPLSEVLKKIGVLVIDDCSGFLSQHPVVLGTYVNPPSIKGVLKAMVVCSSTMETFPKNIREMSAKEKQILRCFLANVRLEYVENDELNLLCSLPLFQTNFRTFVSKNEGLCAAPRDSLPIQPFRQLIDISDDASETLALLLKVRILKPTELLCEVVFPDIQQDKYTEAQVDILMSHVLRHLAHVIHTDANFKRHLQVLPFVPKKTVRVRALEVFDPRSENLQRLFSHEDVFPVGELYNDRAVLSILEALGMKKDNKITAKDLYQSAKEVTPLCQVLSAGQKSSAILQYLSSHPKKLEETVDGRKLGELLKGIAWVSRLQQRPWKFPSTLSWCKTDKEQETHLCKPTEIKSQQLVNLIGSVKPVVKVEPSHEICAYFGWKNKADVGDVVKHLQNVVACYTEHEKPYYMVVVDEIYSFLSVVNQEALTMVFESTKISKWVWNGNGFSSPCGMLPSETRVDLAPYILTLPSEMSKFKNLFHRFGMRYESDSVLLLEVLEMIKLKHDSRKFQCMSSEVKRDIKLSVEILNELATEQSSPEVETRILFPIHVEEDTYVQLEPATRCMYCEHEEWLTRDGDDEDIEYFYLHPNISSSTAERLGVPSLTNRMLDPDELFIGEEFGQEERLTTRLSRLLEDYTDGFAVPKELIQNADDAGATEVRFLYDERSNKNAMTCLIDEGMKGCQGPALWVYNDATFRDEDFVNITRLNEATKAEDTEKIGRFGLGFNAVYNLTDVPMFVSKNYLAIFDPHTSYLGKGIKNKRRPGIKINLNKDVGKLRKFKNQFQPFNGIFGCDLHLEKEDNSFDGTLFRFPLRTKQQAIASEIKQLCYDDQQMHELLQMFIHGAEHLLLFTQNVMQVGIYHLPNLENQDTHPALLFEVNKSAPPGRILRELSFSFTVPPNVLNFSEEKLTFLKQSNFLQAASKVKKWSQAREIDPTKFPVSSMIIDVNCSLTRVGVDFFNVHLPQGTVHWLVVSSMGTGKAMTVAKKDPTLLPAAGVAVQMEPREENTFFPLPIVKRVAERNLSGNIFCYLPLPIHSGLSVHINGAFAVASNRRSLQERVEDDKTWFGVDWNCLLMQDSVVSAFLDLLEDVKSVAPEDGSYIFHSLWPKACQVQHNCWPLLTAFYTKLAGGGYSLFSDGKEWVDITQVVFIDPQFRNEHRIGEAANNILKMCGRRKGLVIDLPCDVMHSFKVCGLEKEINARSYSKIEFFRDVFFPNIAALPSNLRDVLTLHALDINSAEFSKLMKLHACIPASPAGENLMLPSQLVHPNKEAASLFNPEDGRFPFGNEESYLNGQRLAILEQLGMASNDLSWLEVAERADSIHILNAFDSSAALGRVQALLSFMEKKTKAERSHGPNFCERILKASFIPVLKKPSNFPLPWKGDEFEDNALITPEEAYPTEIKYLVCCTEPLTGIFISKPLRRLLHLEMKTVTLEHVMQQLVNAFSARIDCLSSSQFQELDQVCLEAYATLQRYLDVHGSSILEPLRGKSFILVGRRFLSAQQVALTLTADCSPYLFKLPQRLSEAFSPLMREAGVKEAFDVQDFISSLNEVKQTFGEHALDEETLKVTTNLTRLLGEAVRSSGPSQVEGNWGTVHLPDSKRVMRPVSELCIRNCSWLPDEEGIHFVNDGIPWPTSIQLGVKTRREEALRRHVVGIAFGQREKLTNRLKRILTGYPCEKEILKELVQNADDAQATEICFIKDPRHHPNKKVFEDSWKPLQGPALCVYNNKPFTNADIEGIRNLGEGSKSEDPNKTGQYGVGFNAVYHLTDVPSFITKGEEIGDVLCAFDPHCKYVPEATVEQPGVKLKDIPALRKKFPDVFACYLENHFPIDNGTMFRFPLRTQQMSMVSKISRSPATLTMLTTMMEDLKKELFEVLLFVNNVTKITLCEVDGQSEKLINVYTVRTTMSKEDEGKRQAFTEYIRQIGEKTKEREDYLTTQIPVEKVSYVLNMEDNLGNKEKWLIVQQIGFEKTVKESITKAFKRHELGMLPRGGVACLLEKTSRDRNETRKKAFCFLPLPFETDLPVHINGHFALDHEARRNLWRDEAGGYRTDWNSALLADVVASCYLTLLVEVRKFLQLPISSPSIVACAEDEMLRRISSYERLFPLKPPGDPYWKTLVDSVYQELDNMGLKILPVVRSRPTDATREVFDSPTKVEVSWLPPNGNGRNQAFFNNLERKGPFTSSTQRGVDEKQKKLRKRFEVILIKSGFNLVACTMQLCEAFQRSRVPVCIISPASVMEFYKSTTSQVPLCTIGPIPCSVDDTPFKDALGTILVLLYCKELQDFADQLPGLPLLLTKDNCLQLFSNRKPKFLSRFQDILPGSPRLFLHEDVYRNVFMDSVFQQSTVLKPLDAQGFAGNLPETIPQLVYGNAVLVEWSPQQKSIPNQRWISRVWTFLSELTKDTLNDLKVTEESKTVKIKDALGSLANWSILPATEVKTVREKTWLPSLLSTRAVQPVVHHLVPLRQASCVVDYASSGDANQNLVDVLRKLQLPELNYAPLESASPNAVFLIRLLVSSMSIPKSLLTSLAEKIEMDPRSPERLEAADCRVILEYFSRNVRSFQPAAKSRLKKLPFYLATRGGFIHLDQHYKVCVLPIGIPRAEIDVLEHALGTVFLESWSSLTSLFSFLDLECISTVDVYCTHILPNLKEFSANARKVHLEYIRMGILSNITTTEDETRRLLDCLRQTPVISSADGTLKTASWFYDVHVEVFSAMLPPTSFPPEPFNSHEWLTFLRTIGLVYKVSQDLFKRFAEEVAHEAATEPTADTKEKSQVLVKHLIKRPDVVAEGLLPAICGIPFVAGEPVRKPLRDLCQPYQAKKDGSFFAFRGAVPVDSAEVVWTRAHLLPRWADPTCQRHQLGCQSRSIDQYCNDFIDQLQIMKTPSVDVVLDHCRTICTSLQNKSERESSSHQQNFTKVEVMERIYAFLQANASTSNGGKLLELSDTPCILVEQGKRFIFPTQVVLELYERLEIKPYLYSVPREFGKFHHLFQSIGCTKSVTISHYAMVLERLSDKCKNVNLHPEEVRICVRAVQGLFEKLEESTNDTENLSRLYLPGISPRETSSDEGLSLTPVTLHVSSNLLFNDEPPAILNRLQNFNRHFLDLKVMKVVCRSTMTNFRELVMKLPSALRPIMLSSVVNERLCDVHCAVNYEPVESLRQRVSSPQFFSGIVRLIRDENCQNADFDEKVFTSIKSELQSMEICAVGNLRTTLFCDGDLIPESEAEVPSFLDKRKTPGGAMYKVYINVSTALGENTSAVTSLLSCVIVELYGQLLGKRSGLVFQMLNCPINEIWPLLDSLKVRQDDSYCATEIQIFPKLGTFIPLEDHHLLNDAFEEFEPGEYVGYELEDPTLELEEGVATYIYARIVEEVTDQRYPLVAKKYIVNIGDNQVIEVDAADMYKFHRLDATTSAAVVVSDHQRQNSATRPVGLPRTRDKQAVFDEVSDLLEDAWKMPEEKKRKVIKRLFLRWHPDKNVGDEDFCTEFFKHVQIEISRLERGEPRGSQPTTNVDATGSHHSSYYDHFNTWGNRARQHHSQREGYRRRQHFHEDFTGRPNPQPGEAKRWFKQAKADVVAVENDIFCSKPSYEWACFKCHQAAEKALKAAKYTIDVDRSNVHNLNFICCGLDDSVLLRLASQLEGLVGSSTRMRYPDNLGFPRIPNEVYNAQMAEEALRLAKEIVERVKSRIP